MVAYCECRAKKDGQEEAIEYLQIYDLATESEIGRVNLDLSDDPESKEIPRNLYFLSQDSQFMIIRSDDQMGVKIVSLSDATISQEFPKLH
jgi:hypothetical protein